MAAYYILYGNIKIIKKYLQKDSLIDGNQNIEFGSILEVVMIK